MGISGVRISLPDAIQPIRVDLGHRPVSLRAQALGLQTVSDQRASAIHRNTTHRSTLDAAELSDQATVEFS